MIKRRGSLLIELLLSAGILAVIAVVLSGLLTITSHTVRAAKQETTAVELAKESMEELTAIKNTNWVDLKQGQFTVSHDTSNFRLNDTTTDESLAGGFTRRITIEQGKRVGDATGKLSTDGTYVDPAALLATVTVSWSEHGTNRSVKLVNYFTNWKGQS